MIITKRHLSRRTFLRGAAGAAIGLPLLDAMVPALAQAPASALRLCYVYVPNGMVMANWTPAAQGRDFALSPILQPLAPFRNQLLVLSGQQESIFGARAVKSGANAFISKTEDLDRVVQAAYTVLAGYSMFATSVLKAQVGLEDGRPGALIKSLSDRELTVLQYLARGLSNKEIADTLLISNKTISGYKTRIFEKLSISTLVELIDFSRAHQLVT